mgnify:CR=1 FL=1
MEILLKEKNMMRVVKYYIDDFKWFQNYYGLAESQLDGVTRFRAIYTLIGDGRNLERCELTDYEGNKIPFHSLNSYQRGVILEDCRTHFCGEKYQLGTTEPMGVVKIEENFIKEKEYNANTYLTNENIDDYIKELFRFFDIHGAAEQKAALKASCVDDLDKFPDLKEYLKTDNQRYFFIIQTALYEISIDVKE